MKKKRTYKNFAFISYSHADKKAAEELQKVLDDFQLPNALKAKYPDRPEKLREIFRDDTGLPAGSNLTYEIQKQLEQSNYLLVICSPNAVESRWVNKEIEYFKKNRDATHIIPFIIDGVANAKRDGEIECFPDALKSMEIRGANIATFSFERAVIEVIAGALKIEVDDLWQRHVRAEEEKKRALQEQNNRLLRMQSRFLAEKANDLIDEGDSYTARLLALEALPKDVNTPDRPYVAEPEAALRKAITRNSGVFTCNETISFLTYGNDGNIIAGSSYNHVYIWDTTNGAVLKIFEGTNGIFNCNRTKLATIGDKFVRLWDIKTKREIRQFEGHTNKITSLAFSADDIHLASASWDNSIRIWDIRTGECTIVLKGHQRNVLAIAFNPQGNLLASSSNDNTVRIWDFKSGLCIYTFKHTDHVNSAVFSPNGRFVASASDDKRVKIWDLNNGKCMFTLEEHEGKVLSVAFSPNGKYLASSSADKKIRIWDMNNGTCKRVLEGHIGSVNSISYSPKGNILASASDDKTIRLWDFEIDINHHIYGGNLNDTNYAELRSDKKLLLSTSYCDIDLWDFKKNECVKKLRGHTNSIVSASFCFNGSTIISTSWDNTTRLWDVETGECYSIVKNRYLQLNPDRTIFVTADKYDICLWDAYTGNLQKVLEGHRGIIWSAAFDYNGLKIASASQDKEIRIWETKTGKCIIVLRGHREDVYSAIFSPDGKSILSHSKDNEVRLWDVQSGKSILRWEKEILNSSFSLDGQSIIFQEKESTNVYDRITGELKYSLKGSIPKRNFKTMYFDKAILTKENNTIFVWDLSNGQCLNTIKAKYETIKFISFCNEESSILSISSGRTGSPSTIQITKIDTGDSVACIQGINNVSFSPDNLKIAEVSGKSFRLLRMKDRLSNITCSGHSDIISLVFSPNSKIIATSSYDSSIQIWNERGQCIQILNGHKKYSNIIKFVNHGQYLLSSSLDDTIRLWDIGNGKCLQLFLGHTSHISGIVFCKKRNQLISSSLDHTIRIWDIRTGQCVSLLEDDHEEILQIEISPDEKFLLSTSHNNIVIWDINTKRIYRQFKERSFYNLSAFFSPDGTKIASHSYHLDNSIKIWDLSTGVCLHRFNGCNFSTYGSKRLVSFSPDGKRIVGASIDSYIRVWDVNSGVCLQSFKCHFDKLSSVAFSPNGEYIYAFFNNSYEIWECLPIEKLIIKNSQRFKKRQLTLEERKKYYLE